MSPSKWGPPVWNLFHTMAEKIKEDRFSELAPQLFNYITRIASFLPCPDCSQHAIQFLSKVNFVNVKTKMDLKFVLFTFHNAVNKRKIKPLFNYDLLTDLYSNNNIYQVYNNFVSVYKSNGNIRLLAESFQRGMILQDFRKWLMENISAFA